MYEEFIRKNVDELELFEKEPKGELTVVISEKITIFPSGKITGSCHIDFDYNLNLYSKTLEKDLEQIISPHVTCTMNCCACLSDNHITKSKPIELVPL